MATSVKGSANSGKEKRGTSPSNPKPIIKKSPKASSSNQDEKISSTAADTSKPVPNYLKPTRSSSHDTTRLPRKSSSDTISQKPELTRRRSFDRPPPSSQVQRAFRSPPSGPRDIKTTQRSSSFTSKSSTPSTRPTSEKLYARTSSLKDKKVEDPRMSRSRSVKKSTLSSSSSRKEATSSSSPSSKKPPKSMNSESSGDNENRSSVDHLATVEDDFVNLDEQEVQSLPEMSEMPDGNEELADPTNLGVEEQLQHVDEDPKGSPLETNDNHDHLHEVKSADVGDEAVLEEAAVEQGDNGHQTVAEESADGLPEVEAAAEQNLTDGAADQQDDAEKSVPEVEPTETVIEEEENPKETEDQEETDEKQTVISPADTTAAPADAAAAPADAAAAPADAAAAPADAAAAPADAAAAPANAQQSAADKKDKQDYNDVIEETATKLRGKKNKVLALAGAFETVISLQDTTKS